MAERQLSAKDLLEQLYRGLDTMPAVEAEMDARELRQLEPREAAGVVASAQAAPPAPVASDPLAARATRVRSPLVILCGIAVAGTIAAAVLRESETRPSPPASTIPEPQVEQPAAADTPDVPQPAAEVVLVNPFDETEVFRFPPGTSKEEAREAMATLLLNRARERGMR